MSKWLPPDQAGLYVGPNLFGGEGAVITPIRWPPVVHSSIHEEERLKAIGCTDSQLGPVLAPTYNGQNERSVHERTLRAKRFSEQGGLCFWCEKPMSLVADRVSKDNRLKHNGTYASLEHYIPKECGGSNKDENLVAAHANCNHGRKKRRFAKDPIYGSGQKRNGVPYNSGEKLESSLDL